ncbi:hydrogenase nickel incorporation protein HypB [bacterium]|nr:hydrogenase nickel incorporation protein HypB [bacterium]
MAEVKLKQKVLTRNDEIAANIRSELREKGIRCLNLIGSPGSGKTSLLEATFRKLKDTSEIAVIEGDVKTDNDMRRIEALGVKAVQIETGDECHLAAVQVDEAMSHLPLSKLKVLVIENVGNLICPVAFDLGEECRVIVLSVAEGEDKPLKYPAAFVSANAVVITKTDLAPYVDVRPQVLENHARSINPNLTVLMTSAKTGEGIDRFAEFLFQGTKS